MAMLAVRVGQTLKVPTPLVRSFANDDYVWSILIISLVFDLGTVAEGRTSTLCGSSQARRLGRNSRRLAERHSQHRSECHSDNLRSSVCGGGNDHDSSSAIGYKGVGAWLHGFVVNATGGGARSDGCRSVGPRNGGGASIASGICDALEVSEFVSWILKKFVK